MKGDAMMQKTKKLWMRIRRNWGLYLLLLPALILLICFSYKPMYGVLIAFKEYKVSNGILGSPWADPWYKYFKKFYDSWQFETTIINTLTITLYGLVVFPVPIILALGINQMRAGKYKQIFQTITYMPHFISTVVMVGLITLLLSPGSGIFGAICNALGFEAPNLMGKAEPSSTCMCGRTSGSTPDGTASSTSRHCPAWIPAFMRRPPWTAPPAIRRSGMWTSRC